MSHLPQYKTSPFTRYYIIILSLSFFSFSVNTSDKTPTNTTEFNQISDANSPKKLWNFLSNYSAVYEVYYDGDLVGTANEALISTNGRWKLSLNAQLRKLFFKINSNEYSEFIIDNQILKTQYFYSKTEITFKKDKVIEQVFDWNNNVETGFYKNHPWKLPLNEQVFDRMSHTIELRQELLNNQKTSDYENTEMRYKVSNKGRRENYIYKSQGHKKLITPFGNFEAILFERVKKNGDKFLIWLSPKLNYFPIKISQKEKDKSEVSFLLKNLKYLAKSESYKPQ